MVIRLVVTYVDVSTLDLHIQISFRKKCFNFGYV